MVTRDLSHSGRSRLVNGQVFDATTGLPLDMKQRWHYEETYPWPEVLPLDWALPFSLNPIYEIREKQRQKNAAKRARRKARGK